jgi:hypothetical protein
MAKVVYLFGAGASFHCLPVYKNFIDRLRFFVEYMRPTSHEMSSELESIYNRLLEIMRDLPNYGTPDALVRRYYLSGEKKNEALLKNLISTYIIFEQLPKSKELEGEIRNMLSNQGIKDKENNELTNSIIKQIDHRYLHFLTNVLEVDKNTGAVWNDIEVVSWNYDSQFELAYSMIFNESFIESQKDLNDYSWIISSSRYSQSEFKLTKLNGSATYFVRGRENPVYFDLNQNDDKNNRAKLFELLYENHGRYNGLRFAWEAGKVDVDNARVNAKSLFQNENFVLVIVGYSFPDFNRRIDQNIFRDCKASKIYVQDPTPEDVIERLKGVNPNLSDKIVPIRNTDTFHIPIEFWEEVPKSSV